MVAIHPFQSEAISRGARMLRTALGPAIARFLDDPMIVEVMLNPDGRLWIDRLSSGLIDTGERLSALDGERIVRLVAHHVGSEVHAAAPRISAELPETGERFEGLLPPVVAAPAFAIRKPAVAVFTLEDYVAAGIMTSGQATLSICQRRTPIAVQPGNNCHIAYERGERQAATALLDNSLSRCALKSQCTTGPERRIPRWEHEHLLEAVQQRLDQNPQGAESDGVLHEVGGAAM